MKSHFLAPGLLGRFEQVGSFWRHRTRALRLLREQTHIEAPAAQTVRAFRNFSKWASIIALVVGYHVLLGWAFNIGILTRPWPGFPVMKLTEAFCAILAGLALYLVQRGDGFWPKGMATAVQASAGLIILTTLLNLVEEIFNWGIGVEHWLVPSSPEPMSLMSTISFALIGIALLLLDWARGYRLGEILVLVSGTISLLAVAGYIYQADTLQGQMPFYAAVVIFLLSAGVLCARADRGFMAKVTSDSFGGIMARRLLPATLIIPIVLGWLQHRGQRAGLFGAEPGLALFAVANVLVFLTVVWWGVNSLHGMDTKRRQAEHELQETAAKLSRSNADLEQFAYVASHDLKEPLRAISGSIQVLQERYKTQLAGADEIIKHTVDGANRMQTLIDDLLTYSRVATRESPLEPTDCGAVLQEVLANLELAIKESKAVITTDPLPIVPADRVQLLQVFQNLVSNAIKYRSERTPKIHVSVQDRFTEWLFSVRDNGIGIAPQYADRIFRLFQRLHTRKEYTGTGIGLAVCKKIIERHGGRIWVESEPEEGSIFWFTLRKH